MKMVKVCSFIYLQVLTVCKVVDGQCDCGDPESWEVCTLSYSLFQYSFLNRDLGFAKIIKVPHQTQTFMLFPLTCFLLPLPQLPGTFHAVRFPINIFKFSVIDLTLTAAAQIDATYMLPRSFDKTAPGTELVCLLLVFFPFHLIKLTL